MDTIFGNLIPLIIVFMLLRGIMQILLGGKKHTPLPPEEEPELPPVNVPDQDLGKKPDLAAEFERRLKKTTEAGAEIKKAQPVIKERQRVHRDNEEVACETKGRVHRDDEALAHDKGRVHKEKQPLIPPLGDTAAALRPAYKYNQSTLKAGIGNSVIAAPLAGKTPPKPKLKHRALVNGFIMAQVLSKPRALKPYSTEELL